MPSSSSNVILLCTPIQADGNTIDVTVEAEASDLEAYPDTSIHGDLNARFRGGFEIYKVGRFSALLREKYFLNTVELYYCCGRSIF